MSSLFLKKKTLVTVSILAILIISTICLVPSIREQGRRRTCWNNLASIGCAMNLYAPDDSEERPNKLSDLTKYMGGDGNSRMFMCPTAIRRLTSEPAKRISAFPEYPDSFSYQYLTATRLTNGVYLDANTTPLMSDKPGNHGTSGINILMATGRVIWWPGTLEEYAKKNDLSVTVVTNWVR